MNVAKVYRKDAFAFPMANGLVPFFEKFPEFLLILAVDLMIDGCQQALGFLFIDPFSGYELEKRNELRD